ncbi:MAG: tetratricopeptide repeat protein [Cyanobacteria bacterium P01_G01_bin.19]
MEKQLDTVTNPRDNHWLNIAEIVAVAGSISGSFAAVFLQEIFYASIPLSACVALNLVNRKRLLASVTHANNEAIAVLSEQNQKDLGDVCDQIAQLQKVSSKQQDKFDSGYQNLSEQLAKADSDAKQQIQKLQIQYDDLASKTIQIAQNTTSGSAELYYQNAQGYRQMGEQQKAIEEYSKAIKIDGDYAEAYLDRGILWADIGNKQEAVEDLRRAAKLYFDRGDLENYQSIKRKTKNIYQLNSNSGDRAKSSEQVLASSLFS